MRERESARGEKVREREEREKETERYMYTIYSCPFTVVIMFGGRLVFCAYVYVCIHISAMRQANILLMNLRLARASPQRRQRQRTWRSTLALDPFDKPGSSLIQWARIR